MEVGVEGSEVWMKSAAVPRGEEDCEEVELKRGVLEGEARQKAAVLMGRGTAQGFVEKSREEEGEERGW